MTRPPLTIREWLTDPYALAALLAAIASAF